NQTLKSDTVKIDTVDPLVTVTLARLADHNGWYNHAVGYGVSSSSDSTSGIESCQPEASYSSPDSASASASRSCTDVAGNTGSGSVSFQYDGSAPSSHATSPAFNNTATITVNYTASDSGPSDLATIELWAKAPGESVYSKV